jgi:hypothetical protein
MAIPKYTIVFAVLLLVLFTGNGLSAAAGDCNIDTEKELPLKISFENTSTGCTVDADCDLCYKCDTGSCVVQADNEDTKSECGTTDCGTGFCDGAGACDAYNDNAQHNCDPCEICSDSDTACELVTDGTDPFDDCGAVDCTDGTNYYDGWTSNTCYFKADVAAGSVDCDGAGSCEVAADVCPSAGQGASTGTTAACDASEGGCTGTSAPTTNDPLCSMLEIDWVTPTAATNQTNATWKEYSAQVCCRGYDCGDVSATIDSDDNWADEDFNRRRTITLKGLDTETDFVYYVEVDYDSDMQADYDDLRFYDVECGTAGGTELNYELADYDGSSAEVWIRMTSLSSGDNDICMYYGNDAASSGEDLTNTWDAAGYELVYHFAETSGDAIDSSGNSYDGTVGADIDLDQTGKVGGGVDCVGIDSGDYIHGPSATDGLDFTAMQDFTVLWWMYRNDEAITAPVSNSKRTPNPGWTVYYIYDKKARFEVDSDTESKKTTNGNYEFDNIGDWEHGGFSHDWGADVTLWAEGNLDATGTNKAAGSGSITHGAYDFNICAHSDGTAYWHNAYMDEVWVLSKVIDTNYYNLTYRMMTEQATYVTISGTEDELQEGPPTKSGDIPETVSVPFWTEDSNPQNLTLDEDECYTFEWNVYANSTDDTDHNFFVYTNITDTPSTSNITETIVITIGPEAAQCGFVETGDWIYDDGEECTITEAYTKTSGNLIVEGTGSVLIIETVLKLPSQAIALVRDSGRLLVAANICGGTECG